MNRFRISTPQKHVNVNQTNLCIVHLQQYRDSLHIYHAKANGTNEQ